METRERSCCFTGHRPEKITQPERVVCAALEGEIRQAIAEGYTTFISGMARGVDIWAAEIVLKLKGEGADIKLVCASPYEGVERSWSAEWQRRYNAILKSADFVQFVSPSYSRACFQIRNIYMVDNSARVIAVYNGEKGGTRNTVEYARRKNVEVRVIG